MKYPQIQGLEEDKFRRLTGVKRSTFEKMNVFPNAKKLTDGENLFTLGALDSLIMIQFVLGLEDEFGVRIDNLDINYDQFCSFSSIANLLKEKYGQ